MTAPSEPPITVVIANFNRRDDLREALVSVREQDYQRLETMVVDNASEDGSCEMVASEFPEVELIALSENLGMAGYSVGFAHAESELLFQMDNDSLMPDPTVLREVVRRFRDGPPELAAVACRVEEFSPARDQIDALRASDRRRGPFDTGGFHSGGVGLRRSLVNAVGGYHRNIFLYGSELFLEMKLLERGHKIHYFPEILMLHKSSDTARSSVGVYFELRNRYWFMRRFASRGQRLRFFPPMLVHDCFYTIYKSRPLAFIRAVHHGFSTLPTDIRQPLLSSRPQFVARVEEIGGRFGPTALWRRTTRRLREWARGSEP